MGGGQRNCQNSATKNLPDCSVFVSQQKRGVGLCHPVARDVIKILCSFGCWFGQTICKGFFLKIIRNLMIALMLDENIVKWRGGAP